MTCRALILLLFINHITKAIGSSSALVAPVLRLCNTNAPLPCNLKHQYYNLLANAFWYRMISRSDSCSGLASTLYQTLETQYVVDICKDSCNCWRPTQSNSLDTIVTLETDWGLYCTALSVKKVPVEVLREACVSVFPVTDLSWWRVQLDKLRPIQPVAKKQSCNTADFSRQGALLILELGSVRQ